MEPRQEIFDTYWKFAAERQKIFLNRFNGSPAPWTDDQILLKNKFCNVFRASDRVSQFLIRNVIYSDVCDPEDTIFRVIFFRCFNSIQTWRELENAFGPITIHDFNSEKYGKLLHKLMQKGRKIFGGAFILCATKAYGFDNKHENYLALLEHMKKDSLPKKILDANSLKEIYVLLKEYPLIGKFMAYQIAIDINYSDYVNFSENSFTVAGPGAERGIKKCFESTGSRTPEEVIQWMVNSQDKEFARLGLDFEGLWGRKLHAIDCQGLFCEVDKYCRVAFPDVKSNRKRIKTLFRPSSKQIDYFFPPKWGINQKIKRNNTYC